MKLKTNQRVRCERSQSKTRKDGRFFANICKGIMFIGLLVLEIFKNFQ